MTAISNTRVYKTKKGRVLVSDLDLDELIEFWRTKYDAIFAQEVRNRRLWAGQVRTKVAAPSGVVEAVIQDRQIEWDEYVRKQLADLATAK